MAQVGSLVRVLPQHTEGLVTASSGSGAAMTFTVTPQTPNKTAAAPLSSLPPSALLVLWDPSAPSSLGPGQRAECLFEDDGSYYPGSVGSLGSAEGEFTFLFDDGDIREGADATMLRKLPLPDLILEEQGQQQQQQQREEEEEEEGRGGGGKAKRVEVGMTVRRKARIGAPVLVFY